MSEHTVVCPVSMCSVSAAGEAAGCVTSLADAEPDPKTVYRGFKLSIKSDASLFIPHSDKDHNISFQQVQKKSTNLTLSSAPGSLRLSGNKLCSAGGKRCVQERQRHVCAAFT